MIRTRTSVGFGAILLGVLAGAVQAQVHAPCNAGCSEPATAPVTQDRPGIAVFPLDFGGSFAANPDGLERLSIGIQQLLLNHFLQNPAVRIVERHRIKEILDEQGLTAGNKVDAQTAARIGKLVGARYMVLGFYAEVPTMEIGARIVDTETSEILYSRQVSGKRDRLMGLITSLGTQIEEGLKGLPSLPTAVREARKTQEALPAEVTFLYSQALAASDSGMNDVAIDLYQQLTQKFPQFAPAKEALRQLRK